MDNSLFNTLIFVSAFLLATRCAPSIVSDTSTSSTETSSATSLDAQSSWQAAKANGKTAGTNSPAVSRWVDLAGNTSNYGNLTNFAFSTSNGWSGSGTSSSPYSLILDGSTHSSYVDFGTGLNQSNDFTVQTWIKPSSVTSAGTIIIGNGSSSVSGTTSIDKGIVLKQVSSGAIQISVGSKSYMDEVLADSPVAYWRLGESSGATTVKDSSGFNRNAVFGGGVTLGNSSSPALIGDSDTYATFDGSSGYVNVLTTTPTAYTPLYNRGVTAGTIEVWISSNVTNLSGSYMIYGEGGPGAPLLMFYRNNNAISFSNWVWPGTWYTATTANLTWGPGIWHQVVATYDAAGPSKKIYIDGVTATPAATDSNTLTCGASCITPMTAASFGAYYNGGFSYFNGNIDEMAIYHSVLPTARIQAHYAARTRTSCISSIVATNNIWTMLTGIFSSSTTTLSLFQNGVQVCTISNSSGGVFSGSSNSLRFGADSTPSNFWSGSVGGIDTYKEALPSSDVLKLYNSSKSQYGL